MLSYHSLKLVVYIASALLATVAHGTYLPASIAAGSTISYGETVPSTGTTLAVVTMLANAAGNYSAVFQAEGLLFAGTLTISCPTTPTPYNIPLMVTIINGTSQAGMTATAHLVVSGVLGGGSRVSVTGGSYTLINAYPSYFIYAAASVTVTTASILEIVGASFAVPISGGSHVLLYTPSIALTNSSTLTIHGTTIEAHNVRVVGLVMWVLYSASIDLSDNSTLSIRGTTFGVYNVSVGVGSLEMAILRTSSYIALSNNSTLSVHVTTIEAHNVSVGSNWNLVVLYISPIALSDNSTLSVFDTAIGVSNVSMEDWFELHLIFTASITLSTNSTVSICSTTIGTYNVIVMNYWWYVYILYTASASIALSDNSGLSIRGTTVGAYNVSVVGSWLLCILCIFPIALSDNSTLSVFDTAIGVNMVSVRNTWQFRVLRTPSMATTHGSTLSIVGLEVVVRGVAASFASCSVIYAPMSVNGTVKLEDAFLGGVWSKWIDSTSITGTGHVHIVNVTTTGAGDMVTVPLVLQDDAPTFHVCRNYVNGSVCILSSSGGYPCAWYISQGAEGCVLTLTAPATRPTSTAATETASPSTSASRTVSNSPHLLVTITETEYAASTLSFTDSASSEKSEALLLLSATASASPSKPVLSTTRTHSIDNGTEASSGTGGNGTEASSGTGGNGTEASPEATGGNGSGTSPETTGGNGSGTSPTPSMWEAPCPTFKATLANTSSTTLKASIIRVGDAVVALTLPNMTHGAYEFKAAFQATVWEVSTSNAATQDPYSFQVVNGGRVIMRCASYTALVAECRLPGNSKYQPTASETLRVSVALSDMTTQTNDTCIPPASGALAAIMYVDADMTSTLGNAATAVDVVGTTAGGSGTIISLFGGSSMLDLHTLAMLMNSPCASLLNQKCVNNMMNVVSPFYSLGNIAVVFGNIAVTGILTLLQVLVARFLRISRNIPTLAACAAVYFPSLAMKISELMYVGVTVCSYLLLSGARSPLEIVVGILGMLYVVGVPAAAVATIHYKVNARLVRYTQFLSRGVLQRMLLPYGFWTPEVMSRAFGRHIEGFLPGFRMYLSAYPMVVVAVAAIFTHLLPTSVDCFLRFVFTAIVFFIAAISLIATRPHRINTTTGFASLMFVVLGVLSVVLAVAHRSPSETLELVKLVLCAIGVLLSIARIVFDGVTTYLEWKVWRCFREQCCDVVNSEGVMGSANDRSVTDNGLRGLVATTVVASKVASKSKRRTAASGGCTTITLSAELLTDDDVQMRLLSDTESTPPSTHTTSEGSTSYAGSSSSSHTSEGDNAKSSTTGKLKFTRRTPSPLESSSTGSFVS